MSKVSSGFLTFCVSMGLKGLLPALVLLSGLGIFSPAFALTYAAPTPTQAAATLNAAKGLNTFLDGLVASSFQKENNYLIAKDSNTSVVLYKRTDKLAVHIAIITKQSQFGGLLKIAAKTPLKDLSFLNSTTIIVSPNNPLSGTQGEISVNDLPAPVRDSLKAAVPGMIKVTLPTGLYVIGQFRPGSSKFIETVFKEAGLGFPLTASVTVDAGNYRDLIRGKVNLALDIHLTNKNGLARLIELTKIVKPYKDSPTLLSLSAASDGTQFGIAYKAPYMVLGEGPFDTTLGFEFDLGKRALTASLSIGLQKRLVDPVIVPKLIEFKGLTMEGTTVKIEIGPGSKGLEVSAGIDIKKLTIGKMSYQSANLTLAFANGVPAGGMFEMNGTGMLDLQAIAQHAQVAMSANPVTSLVAGGVIALDGNLNLWEKLQLDKLPKIGIKNPKIFLATPGESSTSALAKLKGIAGAGVLIKGDLYVYGKKISSVDFILDSKNGIGLATFMAGFKAGPVEFSGMDFDLMASFSSVPHLRFKTDLKLLDITLFQAEFSADKTGITYSHEDGCTPPMLKYHVNLKGWRHQSSGIDASDCAKKAGEAIVKVSVVAGREISKAGQKAGKGATAAAKKTGAWLGKTSNDAKKFFKDVGCKIEDAFTGGKCTSRKANAARKKREAAKRTALAAATKYRALPDSADCRGGWVWNQQTRTCWKPGYQLLYHSTDSGPNGRCLSKSSKNTAVIWDCISGANQQFTLVPMDRKKLSFVVRAAQGPCLVANGRKVGFANCNYKASNQRWWFIGGRLMKDKLCLRRLGGNVNGTLLGLVQCGASTLAQDIQSLKREIFYLEGLLRGIKTKYEPQIRNLERQTRALPRFMRNHPSQRRLANLIKRKVADERSLRPRIAQKKALLSQRQAQLKKGKGKPAEAKVEWVQAKAVSNVVKAHYARYKMHSLVPLKVRGWCMDGSANLLAGAVPKLRACKRNDRQGLFSISHYSGKYVHLVNGRSRMCMDVPGASRRDRTLVVLWPCHDGKHQQWEIVGNVNSTFQLKNRNSGKCLALFNFAKYVQDTSVFNVTSMQAEKYKNMPAYMRPKTAEVPPDPSKNIKSYYSYKGGNAYVQVTCGKYPAVQNFNIKGWSM